MTSSLLNKALSLNSDSNLLIKQKECTHYTTQKIKNTDVEEYMKEFFVVSRFFASLFFVQ